MIDKWKIDFKPMKSSTYLLPILDMRLNFKFFDRLVGSYMFNNIKDLQFSVLYKFSGKVEYTEFEKEMMTHVLYLGHEDYGEYVLYKFRLTEDMQKTVDKYLRGMYSQFPTEHKDAIQDFLKRRGFSNADRIRMILDRDPSIRKEIDEKLGVTLDKSAELSEAPNASLEVFDQYVKKIKITEGDNMYGNSKKE